jgi:hypothetical protein
MSNNTILKALLKERRELMQAWADHLDRLRRGAMLHQLKAG